MFFLGLIRLSIQNLMISKLTSILTMVGLLFGSAAFIATLSTIEGSKKQIAEQMQNMGIDLVWLRIYPNPKYTVNTSDLEFLKTYIPYISQLSMTKTSNGKIRFQDKELDLSLIGADENYFSLNQLDLKKGSYFHQEGAYSKNFDTILGAEAATKVLADGPYIGQKGYLKVKDKLFAIRVIGVLKRKGNEADNAIIVPINFLDSIVPKSSLQSAVTIKTEAATYAMLTRKIASTILKPKFGDDFYISDAASTIAASKKISDSFNFAGLSLAIISLITGGVGIMNVMLLSVAQRKKEIGLRKALGAKGLVILFQFLMEAVFICIGGCILGSILGVYCGVLMARMMNVQSTISPVVVSISFAFSICIGLGFGMLPALRASRLDPYEALRM
ncbi:MAG: ABC transporter permease [Oligoflexales bacterium]|nr:ABC transporter permease [Oligoflexales bacterium]